MRLVARIHSLLCLFGKKILFLSSDVKPALMNGKLIQKQGKLA
jgi:hypothetical protein